MKQGRLRYEYKIGDLLELADYLTKFISKIDPLIEDFLNTYYDGNNDTQKEIFTVSRFECITIIIILQMQLQVAINIFIMYYFKINPR